MTRWMIRKVMVCLLTVFVTLGLNLPVVEAVAAPVQSLTVTTMDMPSMAMKGVTDVGSKGGCKHCPDMGSVPAVNCGLPCPPTLAGDIQFEFKQAALSISTYLAAELALMGRSVAPETSPPRTLSHV